MFYNNLYISPGLKKKRRKLIRNIRHGKYVPGIYVIAVSKGPNQMELFQSFQLLQPYYKDNLPFILGLASDYESAIKIVQKILTDAFEKTGSYNIKDGFINMEYTEMWR